MTAMTLTERLFARKSGKASVGPNDNVWVNVDTLLTHDVCGPGTIGVFKREFGEDAKVWNPDGVVILEPWFEPDRWHPGQVYLRTVEVDGLKAARMSHSRVDGNISILEFRYLIGTAEGLEERTELHELGLFTRAEIERGFERAGFEVVHYDSEGFEGRGVYLARLRAGRLRTEGP